MTRSRSQSVDLIRIIRGDRYDVLMTRKMRKQYDRLERRFAKDFGRVRKSMMNFAQFGPENLPGEQFRWEGRFPSGVRGAARVRVGVIKGWQARFYGGSGHVDGRSAFIVVEFDQKKQDRADRDRLRSAAHKLQPYLVCS